MKKYEDVLYEVFDEHTREAVVYEEATLWVDGTPMTDAKCDGVYFRKRTSLGLTAYYRRVLTDGVIDFSWYGVKGDGTTDAWPILQQVVDFYQMPLHFRLPKGDILFSNTWVFKDREHTIEGHPQRTRLLFVAGKMGIDITRTTGSQGPRLSELEILGTDFLSDGRLPTGPYPNEIYGIGDEALDILPDFYTREAILPAGTYPNTDYPAGSYWTDPWGSRFPVQTSKAYSIDSSAYRVHGISIKAISYLTNIKVKGFPGTGLALYGNVLDKAEGAAGYDCSRSVFHNVSAEGCTFGWTIGGSDANQCSLYNCEARDNRVVGLADYSFLGNHYVHFHTNNNSFMQYQTTNFNNRSTFTGCYAESGNYGGIDRQSRWSGFTVVDSGIYGSGHLYDDNVLIQEGNIANRLRVRDSLQVDEDLVLGQIYHFKKLPAADGFGFGLGAYTNQNLMQFFQAGTTFPASGGMRRKSIEGINLNQVYLNGVLNLNLGDISLVDADPNNRNPYFFAAYQVGDTIKALSDQGAATPHTYECFQPGQQRSAYTEGLTISWAGGTFYTLSAATTVLQEGDVIFFGGAAMTVGPFQDGGRRTFAGALPQAQQNGSNLAISYATAKFRAMGSGTGTTAQRPTLRVDDAGWRYWNTTTNTTQTWTGTAWV